MLKNCNNKVLPRHEAKHSAQRHFSRILQNRDVNDTQNINEKNETECRQVECRAFIVMLSVVTQNMVLLGVVAPILTRSRIF